MKRKSFECPKSIRNYEKKILGTSDAWSTSRLSHRPSEPAYYIVDCRISREAILWLRQIPTVPKYSAVPVRVFF